MNVNRPKKDIVEIFGYAPNNSNIKCRMFWKLGVCPFIGRPCNKTNHDKTIVYGTCSVTSPKGDCISCPNRIYANNYQTIRNVALDAFGDVEFLMFEDYVQKFPLSRKAVVALGMHSGHEIGMKLFSMDWVLAEINVGKLQSYTGIEVQSIDITGNYRDNWHAYKNLKTANDIIPSSRHGLNWANVHKRLIPQIIRKSLIYSRSKYVNTGLYFIVPDIVYQKFEEIIGSDIPLQNKKAADIITVHTYCLGPSVDEDEIRNLVPVRQIRFKLEDFADRFISGPHLPAAELMDNAVKKALGIA